ncbi:MAG: urea transporter [Bacteroidetes bacterium]|nr:urea transporter [Bacteroidota bacterium]
MMQPISYKRWKSVVSAFLLSIGNSYSQVFFSHSRIFAVILLVVTLFDINAGLAGLISVVISNLAAFFMGFNRFNIKAGYYGFNSLLVGLGLGVFYQPGVEFYLILAFTAMFTLFITLMMEGVIGKYGLPYLSIPFLISLWMVTLAARSVTSLEISEGGIFSLNEMYAIGGINLVKIYEWFNNLNIPQSWVIYFRSLGAIFFQYHLFPGLIIAIGVLICSRISFLLSLVGFFSAYYFYRLIGADISELNYSYIGFNFILTAIAVGGFFIIPSRSSFLWVVLLIPLISITISSTSALFYTLQLSVYSLPFNFIVLLFLYVMKFRERFFRSPELVYVQHHSPEKNLYISRNFLERFRPDVNMSLSLPFYGEWKVTQGYSGKYTHQGEWKHGLDFQIEDEEGKVFNSKGDDLADYYCFNKPVIAPADGKVEEIADGIPDNPVGEVNLRQNWGNTIIIRHTDKLFTKLSHLKEGSFKVAKGDFVKKGDVLAHCGNSGRSPYPHLHFQVQKDPFIGSATIHYPFAYYISFREKRPELKAYAVPEENELLSNISRNAMLKKAFGLVPGQKFSFLVKDLLNHAEERVSWKVEADSLNNTYIKCEESGSRAYFKAVDGVVFFIDFTGNRKSLLYYFYLGAFKVIYGYYQGITINDRIPDHMFTVSWIKPFQDFMAPFLRLVNITYTLELAEKTSDFLNEKITLNSKVNACIGKKPIRNIRFRMEIADGKLSVFTITAPNKEIKAIWED